MKIAIPLAGGKLAMHFGHCDVFAILDVDADKKAITARQDIEPPPHQPGMLPPWLGSQGVNVVIAGGMGQRALSLFAEQGIQVLTGAPAQPAEVLVRDYLAGTIATGDNVCDH